MSQTDGVRGGPPHSTVEFLDDETPGHQPTEAMDSHARGTRWPNSAVIVCVLAALSATWLANRQQTNGPVPYPATRGCQYRCGAIAKRADHPSRDTGR